MDIVQLRRPYRACIFSMLTQGYGRFAASTLGFAAPSLRDWISPVAAMLGFAAPRFQRFSAGRYAAFFSLTPRG